MKQKHFIDIHKGVTLIYVLLLIAFYHQWDNNTAWVYLALHGTYGILWVFKSRVFPDRQWEQETSWAYGLVIWGGLSLYWIAPWLLTWRGVSLPGWSLAVSISVYSLGVFLHFAADMQKFTALQLHPGHLISDGLFARVRNPNYFGELLIYASFASLARHWLPWVILLTWNVVIWLPNMRKKERSLARYAEFEAYQRRSKLYIPFIY